MLLLVCIWIGLSGKPIGKSRRTEFLSQLRYRLSQKKTEQSECPKRWRRPSQGSGIFLLKTGRICSLFWGIAMRLWQSVLRPWMHKYPLPIFTEGKWRKELLTMPSGTVLPRWVFFILQVQRHIVRGSFSWENIRTESSVWEHWESRIFSAKSCLINRSWRSRYSLHWVKSTALLHFIRWHWRMAAGLNR